MEKEQEELYICDHADECDEPCVHKVKHHRSGGACCYDEGTCELARMKVTCIPYKEKEEPKTKRVAVIWFGDVPEYIDYLELHGFNTKTNKCECLSWIESIDPNRLRYDIPNIGDNYLSYIGIVKHQGYEVDKYKGLRLIIDPPTPEPETVVDVLKRMPKTKDYIGVDGYWCDMEDFEEDLKAAQEREE